MFHPTLTRLFAIFLAVAAFATVVFAAPVGADNLLVPRGGIHAEKRGAGKQLAQELSNLKLDLASSLGYTGRGKSSADETKHITSLFKASENRIANMDKDQTGELDGQAQTIKNLFHSINADMNAYMGGLQSEESRNMFGLPSVGAGLADIGRTVAEWGAGVLNAAGQII
ncbi:hypothetical protein RHS03_05846, partial [Rhizoctonia solani]